MQDTDLGVLERIISKSLKNTHFPWKKIAGFHNSEWSFFCIRKMTQVCCNANLPCLFHLYQMEEQAEICIQKNEEGVPSSLVLQFGSIIFNSVC